VTEKLFDCPKFVDEDREVRSMLVFWLDVIYLEGQHNSAKGGM